MQLKVQWCGKYSRVMFYSDICTHESNDGHMINNFPGLMYDLKNEYCCIYDIHMHLDVNKLHMFLAHLCFSASAAFV